MGKNKSAIEILIELCKSNPLDNSLLPHEIIDN